MLTKLWGLSWQNQTKTVIQMMEDANIRYEFIDVESTDSPRMAQILALTGEKELPQLFVGGTSYVGKKEIRTYIRE